MLLLPKHSKNGSSDKTKYSNALFPSHLYSRFRKCIFDFKTGTTSGNNKSKYFCGCYHMSSIDPKALKIWTLPTTQCVFAEGCYGSHFTEEANGHRGVESFALVPSSIKWRRWDLIWAILALAPMPSSSTVHCLWREIAFSFLWQCPLPLCYSHLLMKYPFELIPLKLGLMVLIILSSSPVSTSFTLIFLFVNLVLSHYKRKRQLNVLGDNIYSLNPTEVGV